MDENEMTPRRPYLFKAFYDWIVDNELTPYLVVNAVIDGVLVPTEFIKDNQIVLNIAPQSVGQYSVSSECIEFNARFGGNPHHIVIPFSAVEAIYAKENGVGIGFDPEPQYEKVKDQPPKPPNPFRVVK